MTKEREALKLAFDVLVEINKLSIGENAICLPAEIDTAMDAAKEVLAQPEQEPTWWLVEYHDWAREFVTKKPEESIAIKRVTALYTAPPQPEPPPECQTEAEKTAFAFGWFKAMEAQRLAQPAQQWQSTADKCELEKVPANGSLLPAQQKPVAWMYEWDGRMHLTFTDQRFVEEAHPHFNKSTPLYTAPPQRTWVGLTDEDIKAVNAQVSQIPPIDYTTTTYAKAIEAKLKEKNLETRTGAT